MSKKDMRHIKNAVVDLRLHGGAYDINHILRMHDETTKKYLIRLLISKNIVEQDKDQSDVYRLTYDIGWNYEKDWFDNHPKVWELFKGLMIAFSASFITFCFNTTSRKKDVQDKFQEVIQVNSKQDLRIDRLIDSVKTLQKICR